MKTFRCEGCAVGPCGYTVNPKGWGTTDNDKWVCPVDGEDDADWEEITE